MDRRVHIFILHKPSTLMLACKVHADVYTLLMLEVELHSLFSQATAESLRTHFRHEFRAAVLQVVLACSLMCSLPIRL